jgi:hypothetical protein
MGYCLSSGVIFSTPPSRMSTLPSYDLVLLSVKQMSSSDLTVAVSSNADGQVVIKKIDPNDTHPFSMAELLERANAKRVGRELTTYLSQLGLVDA